MTNSQLASMGASQIAAEMGCHYSGDENVLLHGGFFYDAREWEEYGYASVVEFHESEGVVTVSTGTVCKRNLEPAFKCIGYSGDLNNIHAQIEACRAYGGIEWDGFSRSYRLCNWREGRLWARIRHLIEGLA